MNQKHINGSSLIKKILKERENSRARLNIGSCFGSAFIVDVDGVQ